MNVNGVSFSSDRKLARCEQQYQYNYGENLQLKRKKKGLFRGSWGHELVEAYYRGKMAGETTNAAWMKKLQELKEQQWNRLFDDEKEDYGMDWPDTIQELVEHYIDHWSDMERRWTIISVEQDYKLMAKAGFPIRWKADLIVEEENRASTARVIRGHEKKRRLLVEHKFKKAIPSSEERVLQPQVHSYSFLLSKVGLDIDGIIWDYIRTEPVPRPQILKSGGLSQRKINTDQRGYLKSLKEAGITPANEQQWLEHQEIINGLPDTLTLERVRNSTNLQLGESFVKQWVERAKRAQRNTNPLRVWNSNCRYDCDFYILCQADMLGKVDRDHIIRTSYEPKPPKEELK